MCSSYAPATPEIYTLSLHDALPIFEDNVVGEAARNLFRDAQAMLKRIVEEKPIRASAVIGFWPAGQTGDDDIAVYADESRRSEEHTSELQSRENLVCRLLLEKKKNR